MNEIGNSINTFDGALFCKGKIEKIKNGEYCLH